MRSPTVTALVFVLLNRQVLAGSDGRTAAPIDLALARQYFDESKIICEHDGGRLWGKSLCGPLLFADPKTRAIFANQSDKEGKLRDDNGVFVGTLPADQNIANTAFTWAGVKWTMVAWPLPGDRLDRARVLLHELWHRVQDDLGLPSTGPSNSHLDGLDGRTWLRLEWAALRKALESQGDDRRRMIEHALTFRAYRRSLFPDATEQERSLEMHEGLANYTGVALADADPAVTTQLAIRTLDAGLKTPSFTRSFAYASGPAYGMLLDAMRPDWRRNLSSKADLGELLGGVIGFAPPGDLADQAKRRAASHDGDRTLAEETERDRKHKERLADAQARLVDGPVLRLPFQNMKVPFDPDEVFPLGEAGTVYPSLRIVDEWGILTVTNRALIDKNWGGVQVAVGRDSSEPPVRGDDWTLQLNDGWTPKPGPRPGDWVLTRE